MSSLRDPVGPKDRKVYIRRRIIVLAALLGVIAAVVLIIVKPGSQSRVESASQVSMPSDLDAEERAAVEQQEGEIPACKGGNLEVIPVTNESSYAEGEFPKLSMTIENTGDDECSADLGTAGMQFEVTSGSDQVWNSVDCQENPENLAVALKPGQVLETEEIAWDRTRSSAQTCDITRDPVAADGASYHLHVTAAGVKGTGSAQFQLY
ncbi:hypothetical protein [Leucobacter sp. GX24907]